MQCQRADDCHDRRPELEGARRSREPHAVLPPGAEGCQRRFQRRVNLPPGLTIAAENPVYVQGNYNSDGDFAELGNVPAAIMADAVTLLSNNWNDFRSFNSPTNSTNRDATTTSYPDGGHHRQGHPIFATRRHRRELRVRRRRPQLR